MSDCVSASERAKRYCGVRAEITAVVSNLVPARHVICALAIACGPLLLCRVDYSQVVQTDFGFRLVGFATGCSNGCRDDEHHEASHNQET